MCTQRHNYIVILLIMIQVSHREQSVLGVYRAQRPSSSTRMPSPYQLLARSRSPSLSQIRSGMSENSSVTGSVETTNSGITRQIKRRTRKSGTPSMVAPLTPEDKLSRDCAASMYIVRICRTNCMPPRGTKRTELVGECIMQANAVGLREGRPAIIADKVMVDKVSHIIVYCSCLSQSNYCHQQILQIASAWRSRYKAEAIASLPLWAVNPTSIEQRNGKMDAAACVAYTASKVAALLLRESFCDYGNDGSVSIQFKLHEHADLLYISGPSGPI